MTTLQVLWEIFYPMIIGTIPGCLIGYGLVKSGIIEDFVKGLFK